ncbi:MAG: hypothetical protein HXX81_02530 [Campylobacterales bacterium]|nr:hypothetical protein [Campylobacterales bacterium]
MQNMSVNNIQSQYISEDEIDLKELFNTILKYKKHIFLFTTVVTIITLMYILSIPNVYKSEVTLSPQQEKSPSLGGLGALAGMAGIDIGGGGSTSPDISFNLVLNDFSFMREFINKHNLTKKLNDPKISENYTFALGFRTLFDIKNGLFSKSEMNEEQIKAQLFETYKLLTQSISISADKKSLLITATAKHSDPTLAKYLIEIFLKDASDYLIKIDLEDLDKKITYYETELKKATDPSLKAQLSQLMSALIQKKVLIQASEYYNVKQIIKPVVAHPKNKEGPKRAMILIVSFVTSFILSIFGVFFIEFIKAKKEE